MEILLLGIYSAIVWFVFIKMKWLPWNTGTQVTVVIIPIVSLTALILTLNVVAPSSPDVRVVKYVINVVPQVRGRVIEVPVEPNRLVHKGDILFRLDPTPYELTARSLEAQLANTVASSNELTEQIAGAVGKIAESRGSIQQAEAKIQQVQSQLDLARMRVAQNRELVKTGAGDKFSLERAETDVRELEAQLNTARSMLAQARATEVQARASERQLQQRSAGKFDNEYAPVAAIRAQLENAKWELSQTTTVAPGNGTMVNVMLRPGFFVSGMPFNEVMTFVDNEYQIFALFNQNELHQVDKGNEAEITLDTYPGQVIKAHVDSIIWAQGQGQLDASGNLPKTTFVPPPGRFPVKLVVADRDKGVFLAAGARGSAALYTEHLTLVHIIRKVLMRVQSYFDYIIIKHSISLGH